MPKSNQRQKRCTVQKTLKKQRKQCQKRYYSNHSGSAGGCPVYDSIGYGYNSTCGDPYGYRGYGGIPTYWNSPIVYASPPLTPTVFSPMLQPNYSCQYFPANTIPVFQSFPSYPFVYR